ncbi:MAG: type II secretory pathway, component PulD, partial [Isosphaeraceae bacterium]
MGRLSTLTVILILGSWGAATEGAALDDAASSPVAASRKPAPVPPIKYLEAGAKLFNSGNFELATKYLNAARMYRDQLQTDEQDTLDAYLKELSKVQAPAAATASPAPAAAAQTPAPAAASGTADRPGAPVARTTIQTGDPVRGGAGSLVVTADTKQQAQWLLQEAGEQMALGNYDAAEKKLAQAEAMDVKWGLFDITPAKLRAQLMKERPKKDGTVANVASTLPGDHKAAKAKLREARAALSNHQYEQAEAIAREVKNWNLNYGFFEDNPDKVAAAARALRKRDRIRNLPAREQPSQGVYDVLVQESRELMKKGQLDAAEAKARQAERMNVVPPLTADRAESVLHDIAMARSRTSPGAPAVIPAADSAAAAAEHEANELLAKGNETKAYAKFAEAEKLRQ